MQDVRHMTPAHQAVAANLQRHGEELLCLSPCFLQPHTAPTRIALGTWKGGYATWACHYDHPENGHYGFNLEEAIRDFLARINDWLARETEVVP